MSLVPLIDGRVDGSWRKSILIEYYSDTVFERVYLMGYKAVRTERYKYIQYQDLDGMDEFYDLAYDPYELKNLINDPRSSAVITDMKLELRRLLTATDGL
jgi:N-acetylglucosamine-6-sulfatase